MLDSYLRRKEIIWKALFKRYSSPLLILILAAAFFSGCAKPPLSSYPSETSTPGSYPKGVFRTVSKDETLWRIAQAYGVEVRDIMEINRIFDPTNLRIGEKIFIPGARRVLEIETYEKETYQPEERIERVVNKKGYRNHNWRYITLHHSATKVGNAQTFHKYHCQKGMGGLFYHFVIGNGTYSRDGEVEAGWRWIKQVEANRRRNIEICLVGNFNVQHPTGRQYQSLLALIKILRREHNIPLKNIRGHSDIKITECPGRNLSMWRLKRDLQE